MPLQSAPPGAPDPQQEIARLAAEVKNLQDVIRQMQVAQLRIQQGIVGPIQTFNNIPPTPLTAPIFQQTNVAVRSAVKNVGFGRVVAPHVVVPPQHISVQHAPIDHNTWREHVRAAYREQAHLTGQMLLRMNDSHNLSRNHNYRAAKNARAQQKGIYAAEYRPVSNQIAYFKQQFESSPQLQAALGARTWTEFVVREGLISGERNSLPSESNHAREFISSLQQTDPARAARIGNIYNRARGGAINTVTGRYHSQRDLENLRTIKRFNTMRGGGGDLARDTYARERNAAAFNAEFDARNPLPQRNRSAPQPQFQASVPDRALPSFEQAPVQKQSAPEYSNLEGLVLNTRDANKRGGLVEVNIGRRNLLQPGMRLHFYRNGSYLGTGITTGTMNNERAVIALDQLARNGGIQKGDTVGPDPLLETRAKFDVNAAGLTFDRLKSSVVDIEENLAAAGLTFTSVDNDPSGGNLRYVTTYPMNGEFSVHAISTGFANVQLEYRYQHPITKETIVATGVADLRSLDQLRTFAEQQMAVVANQLWGPMTGKEEYLQRSEFFRSALDQDTQQRMVLLMPDKVFPDVSPENLKKVRDAIKSSTKIDDRAVTDLQIILNELDIDMKALEQQLDAYKEPYRNDNDRKQGEYWARHVYAAQVLHKVLRDIVSVYRKPADVVPPVDLPRQDPPGGPSPAPSATPSPAPAGGPSPAPSPSPRPAPGAAPAARPAPAPGTSPAPSSAPRPTPAPGAAPSATPDPGINAADKARLKFARDTAIDLVDAERTLNDSQKNKLKSFITKLDDSAFVEIKDGKFNLTFKVDIKVADIGILKNALGDTLTINGKTATIALDKIDYVVLDDFAAGAIKAKFGVL